MAGLYQINAIDPASIVAFGQARASLADQYILRLGQLNASLQPPTIEYVGVDIPSAPLPVTTPLPEMQDIVWAAPGIPPEFTQELSVDTVMPEPFDDNPPEMIIPAAPSEPTDVVPAAPGVSLSFEYPELDFQLPAAPSLLSISVSPFGGLSLPAAPTDDIPTLNLLEPTVREYTPGSLYTSGLLTAIRAKLLDRITNGGTGLPPAVEQAIWDRGREREYRQLDAKIAELERMERLGYAFPPGVYIDGRIKLQNETEAAIAGHSREVMIKQAELEQANIQKALELSVGLEGKLMDYTNAVEQRIFESCKYATEAGIAIYNAKVEGYKAYLAAYQTKVEIYKAQIQGELAKVDAYKTQVEAERVKAEVNTALVEQFKAQIQAALANVDVYKAKVDIIRTKAEIEKIKVEVFGEQIKAYTAKINAFSTQVEAYRARIGAETSKQEAFKSRVSVYATQVGAAAKLIDAKISEYKGRLDANLARWEGYKAQVHAEASRVGGIAEINKARAETYKAEVSATSAYNEVLTKQWSAAVEIAEKVAEVQTQVAKMNAELYVTSRSLAMEAAKVGAQVAAQLGAAALNAVNFNQSQSASGSVNSNYNYTYSA